MNLNFRRASSLPFGGSFPKGATRFYPGAQEKPFGFSLASLSASATGVIATTNRSVVPLDQNVTTLFAVPSLVSKAVTSATGRLIPKRIFCVKVLCVLFFERRSDFVFSRRMLSISLELKTKKQFRKWFHMMRVFNALRIAA